MKLTSDSSAQFPILVINLSRRPDRLERISVHMSGLGLDFVRINATDGHELSQLIELPPFLTHGHIGAVESHRTAWKWLIENDIDGALILEDDVILDNTLDWNDMISRFNLQMARQNIGLLQLGFIHYGLRGALSVKVRDMILRRRELLGRRRIVTFESPTRKVDAVIGSLRDGAHCYLMRRQLAIDLVELNSPPFLPIDIMLETIGRRKSARTAPFLARVKSSLATQLSRDGRSTLDSDIDA